MILSINAAMLLKAEKAGSLENAKAALLQIA